MKTDTTEPVYETSKTEDKDKADKDNFNNRMERSIHGNKIQENEKESTVSTKMHKKEKYEDQNLDMKLYLLPSLIEVNNEYILDKAISRAEKEEFVRPKDMTMKHSTNEADEVDTYKDIIEEAKTVDPLEILSEVVIDSDLCSPKTFVLNKINTDSGLHDKDQDSEDDRKTIISKIQENIEVIDLYERRIKSIAQTIIKHETACEENIKYFPELNGQNKEKTKLNIAENNWSPERIGKDILLFLLLLLLGLVLLHLTLDPSC